MIRLLLITAVATWASENPDSDAARALEEGLPTVALELLKAGDSASLLAARAHLALSDAESALSVLETIPDSPDKDFWMAEALALQGDYERALHFYEQASLDPQWAKNARQGSARMLAALGRRAEAAALFRALVAEGHSHLDYAAFLLDGGDIMGAFAELEKAAEEDAPRRSFLWARAAFAAGDAEAALIRLDTLTSPGPELGLQAALLRAEILEALGKTGEAEDTLEKIIENHPLHPRLDLAFHQLDLLMAVQDSPSSSEFRRWSKDEAFPRRASLAAFYLGKNELRLGRRDRAEAAFLRAARLSSSEALTDAAAAEYLRLVAPSTKLKISPSGPRSHFEYAALLARQGHYGEAARLFAEVYSQTYWPTAAENARLCKVAAGEPLPDLATAPKNLAEAEALRMASAGHPAARERLELLAQELGSSRARLALAELAYREGKWDEAQRELRRVSSSDRDSAERALALEIFLSDDGTLDGAARVVAKAGEFYTRFPNGLMAAQVALKRGEAYFRRGDFAAAREDFERADAATGDAGTSGAAFLAALCAARSLDTAERAEALEIFDQIARSGGALAGRARLEQAFLLTAENRRAESLAVLDALLQSDPAPEIRWAALIEKGDTLFAAPEAGPQEIREAIGCWRLVADSEAAPPWRNQALAKIAVAHEKLGEIPAALAAAWRALEQPESSPPDNFWSVKAGFDAARLLESQSRLDEAMVLYEKLALRGGARSSEARQRLERLRLENFLWDENLPPPIPQNP